MTDFDIDAYPARLRDELRHRDLEEIRKLRTEVADTLDRIDEIAPLKPSRDDLIHLARTNPAEFNRLYESGEISNDSFAVANRKDTKK